MKGASFIAAIIVLCSSITFAGTEEKIGKIVKPQTDLINLLLKAKLILPKENVIDTLINIEVESLSNNEDLQRILQKEVQKSEYPVDYERLLYEYVFEDIKTRYYGVLLQYIGE